MKTRLILGILLKVVPLVTAFLATTDYIKNFTAKIVALICSIFLYVVAEVLTSYRPSIDLMKIRRKLLDETTKSMSEIKAEDGQTIKLRLNLMLAKRPFWWPFKRRFIQHWQNNLMKSHPDANLIFWADQGCCGYEFQKKTQKPEYYDLRKPLPSGIKVTERMKRDAAQIKAILTIPLRKERGHNDVQIYQEYFGVLNADALDDPGAELLATREMADRLTAAATLAEHTFP